MRLTNLRASSHWQPSISVVMASSTSCTYSSYSAPASRGRFRSASDSGKEKNTIGKMVDVQMNCGKLLTYPIFHFHFPWFFYLRWIETSGYETRRSTETTRLWQIALKLRSAHAGAQLSLQYKRYKSPHWSLPPRDVTMKPLKRI